MTPRWVGGSGDGDWCPQDNAHGKMYLRPTGNQWCPNVKHTGNPFYRYDGLTPFVPERKEKRHAVA